MEAVYLQLTSAKTPVSFGRKEEKIKSPASGRIQTRVATMFCLVLDRLSHHHCPKFLVMLYQQGGEKVLSMGMNNFIAFVVVDVDVVFAENCDLNRSRKKMFYKLTTDPNILAVKWTKAMERRFLSKFLPPLLLREMRLGVK